MLGPYQGKEMIIEETKAVKIFMWMFYIIFFTYELFYYFIRPLSLHQKVGLPDAGMGFWFYIILLSMLPLGIYLVKVGKPYYVKYIFFTIYNLFDFINVLMVFSEKHEKVAYGNVLDVFLILFASIFVNKQYVWIISIGIIIKYFLIGTIFNEINFFLPIGVFVFLFIFSLIILSRFTSYVNSLTNAYEEIRNKERQAFLGQLATSIGHEIRNPLSSLKGFTQLQQERDKSEVNFYPIMIQEIDRINSIVDDLMVLGRPKAPNFKYYDLIKIVDYVTSVTTQLADNYGSKIIVNHDDSLPLVECNEKQIKQALINILKNAIESMQHGGSIEVFVAVSGPNKIKVAVQDHGCGVDPEKLKKLGEPFYTTKQDGTGLGLLVTKKIIEDHRGELLFESKKEQGTKVTMILPINQK